MSTATDEHKEHISLKDRASRELRDVAQSTGNIVIVDFLLGAVIFAVGVPLLGFPMGSLAAMVLVGLSIFRRPKAISPYTGFLLGIMVLALGYVAFNSFLMGNTSSAEILRRVIRIGIVVMLAVFIADKRIDFKSLILGLSFGLVINALAFYAGIAPDNYGGTLTGWLNDKNQAGLYYAIIGFFLVTSVQKLSHRVIALVAFSGFLYLTGSRTSIAAFVFGLLWVVFARKLNLFLKAILAVFLVWAVNYLEDNFAQVGEFSNRVGSDLLRARIDQASQMKLDAAPWNGLGLGEAFVDLDDRTFFFHNSFWTQLVEGGWIYLTLILIATVVPVYFLKQKTRNSRQMAAEGAMILLFICSWRLGEVLLTMPWGLTVGLGLLYLSLPSSQAQRADELNWESWSTK